MIFTLDSERLNGELRCLSAQLQHIEDENRVLSMQNNRRHRPAQYGIPPHINNAINASIHDHPNNAGPVAQNNPQEELIEELRRQNREKARLTGWLLAQLQNYEAENRVLSMQNNRQHIPAQYGIPLHYNWNIAPIHNHPNNAGPVAHPHNPQRGVVPRHQVGIPAQNNPQVGVPRGDQVQQGQPQWGFQQAQPQGEFLRAAYNLQDFDNHLQGANEQQPIFVPTPPSS